MHIFCALFLLYYNRSRKENKNVFFLIKSILIDFVLSLCYTILQKGVIELCIV